MEFEVSTIIERSAAVVWDFYAVHHVQNHPRWDPDMSLEQVTSGPIGVGTVIRRRYTRFGVPFEGTMEIVEFDPLRAMGAKIRDGQTEMTGRATLTAEGQNRTRLTTHVDLTGADPTMAEKLTPLVQRAYDTIKRRLSTAARRVGWQDPARSRCPRAASARPQANGELHRNSLAHPATVLRGRRSGSRGRLSGQ